MAYNGGLEESQNWPFSVRYTASPYRKSKFPLDPHHSHLPPPPAQPHASGTVDNNTAWLTSNGTHHHHHHHHNHHQQQQQLPNYPFPYVNTATGSVLQSGYRRQFYNNNNNNGHDVYIEDESDRLEIHSQQQSEQQQHHRSLPSHHYSLAASLVDPHNHYGLPVPHSLLPTSSSANCDTMDGSNFFIRYPHHFPKGYLHPDRLRQAQVEGLLDEGYIEELKQPYNNTKLTSQQQQQQQQQQSDKNNSDYDPYSYVYDSNIQEDLTVRSSSLCCGASIGGGGNNNSDMPGEYSRTSENEYEEIRDVARYMNGGLNGGPLHFKSFSSTDDILAEVVQVQRGHDRVLDQLNLEVENLLISTSDDIVESGLDKMSSVSLNGIYQECYCDAIPSVPQFATLNSPMLRGPAGHSSLSSSSSKDSGSCCCCVNNKDDAAPPGPAPSTEGPEGLEGNSVIRKPVGQFQASTLQAFMSLDPACSAGNNGTGTLTRKKKLEHQLSDTKLLVNQHHHNHHHLHHHLPPTSLTDKHWKNNRHHRSYSLIPHWKIREHLRRLPFLRQQHKLKKTEGLGTSTTGPPTSSASSIPISASAQDFLTNNKMSGGSVLTTNNKDSSTPPVSAKARSSSMDELRATGPEEHWYSADSDTEPDSLTLLQEPCPINNDGIPSLGNTISTGISGTRVGMNSTMENGSRLDLGSAIPEAPKAPKFRRGTGLKDKWRESWSSSTKTLAKPAASMDEENRLLRWFSLRKNQANIEPPGSSSRHSTLPLLSEEDLKRISYIEDEEGYWPRRTVQPPSLPPPPSDLSPEKITRRHIVAAIVHSENSYVAALQRLVNEYKKPLERSHPAILSHSKISSIFHRVPEILQCHSLFRIALAECVRRWDADEKIGDVFVASFSKSLVLDVYSEFINNFGSAMETAKVEARRKSAFADFLKVKQMTAHDRLSLFGLMVKPVQRFPQFILLLQDLLKHTPKDHHDRMSLQLALTQLESLAAMLNERKRESEQYQAFRETIKSIGGGKFVLLRSIADDPNRILLRQDVVTQLEFDSSGAAVAKSKSRKLLLLNDMLICVALSQSNSSDQQTSTASSSSSTAATVGSESGGNNKVEKSVFKWSYPVRDVEVEDISISPTMSRFVHGGATAGKTGSFKASSGPNSLPEVPNNSSISLLEEMQSLMHDYEVLSRILTLVSSLKSAYEGLTEGSVKELMLEIQHQIRCRDEQISYFDSSCLTLLLGTGNNRDKVVFQMHSPQARNEWIEELRLAQLALDPNNSPSWDIPSESPYPPHKLPLFVRSLTLTKSPNKATVKCGCYFTHTFVSPTGRSKILDYLWVSSTDGMSSHVTAFRAQQNALKEVSSFDLVEEKVNDLLFVNGYVWVATKSRKIMTFDPADPDKGSVSSYLLSDSVLKLTQFESNIYAGLADGTLAVFTDRNPESLKPAHLIKIGQERVRSVFGSKNHIYAACGNAVVSIDIKTHTIERNVVLNHHNGPIAHMTCSGVGLWITTQDSGTVCLYHLESLQHLQDVSVAPSVYRTVRDSFRRQEGCYVTCLTAHKGWLWIGTNLGVILTIPLPRLEGVPIISTGKANVSYHGYTGPVSFLMPLTKPAVHSNGTNRHYHNHHHQQPRQKEEPSPPPPVPLEASPSPTEKAAEGDKNLTTNNNSDENLVVKETGSDCVNSSNSDRVNNNAIVDRRSNSASSNSSSLSSKSNSPAQSAVELKEAGDSPHSSMSLTRTLSDTGSVGDGNLSNSKTLVVLRKKNSRDNVFLRNCKTLPRGGPLPSNLRFSIDSDVYGLYGNLINVRGLEDEGRFVDPLYDALRRSDPELVALDSKISTLDRRMKMRMSRPRSLDLSNWSVDSKISASSDESVGARNNSPADPVIVPSQDCQVPPAPTDGNPQGTGSKKTLGQRQNKNKNKNGAERTVMVVVGGRGYLNLRNQPADHFVNCDTNNSDSCTSSKHYAHLTVWQMKT